MNNNTLTAPTAEEQWRYVPGYNKDYAVSDQGRVISYKLRKPRMMALHVNRLRGNYLSVVLCNRETGEHNRMRVHSMVMLAFVGPRPEGMEIRHLDGNPQNNRISNLAYGTKSENMKDAVKHGTHNHASKTHCKNGHEFNEVNLRIGREGGRYCRQCQRDRYAADPKAAARQRLEARHRQKARELANA